MTPKGFIVVPVTELTIGEASQNKDHEKGNTGAPHAGDSPLGGGRIHSGTLVLSVRVLDRVAEVVRLGRYQGMSFETIFVLLGDTPVRPFDE